MAKLEEIAEQDYQKTRENILDAQSVEVKDKENEQKVKVLINEILELLDAYNSFWHEYEEKKDNEALTKCARIALEARLKSEEAIILARLDNLNLGIKVVQFLTVVVGVLFVVYTATHWYWDIKWFHAVIWWEVIFFSLFGSLTNLTYSAAMHVYMRDFDNWHMGWYWSKLPQAPFVSLAIIIVFMNIKIMTADASIDFASASNEVIAAVAYFLGLFSRRAWKLMELIKDKLIPLED